MPDCIYCGDKGIWWCGCDCCDDKFMVCNDCGKDIPLVDQTKMKTIKNAEKWV